MSAWLAVVAFCINGECGFMVSNKNPMQTQEECAELLNTYLQILKVHGAEMVLPTCVQLKYKVS